jgi:hypothetical protein
MHKTLPSNSIHANAFNIAFLKVPGDKTLSKIKSLFLKLHHNKHQSGYPFPKQNLEIAITKTKAKVLLP